MLVTIRVVNLQTNCLYNEVVGNPLVIDNPPPILVKTYKAIHPNKLIINFFVVLFWVSVEPKRPTATGLIYSLCWSHDQQRFLDPQPLANNALF